ncbi:MAG: hypothetical protein ACRDJE_26715 [Dehalococcoidia bacterium]
MVLSRGLVNPGLDWVVSAGEGEMLDYLGPEVACPRCGHTLRQDSLWSTPNLADDYGHSFSNVRALMVELYQRGMLRPKSLTGVGFGG